MYVISRASYNSLLLKAKEFEPAKSVRLRGKLGGGRGWIESGGVGRLGAKDVSGRRMAWGKEARRSPTRKDFCG